jgi:hypothetical protein
MSFMCFYLFAYVPLIDLCNSFALITWWVLYSRLLVINTSLLWDHWLHILKIIITISFEKYCLWDITPWIPLKIKPFSGSNQPMKIPTWRQVASRQGGKFTFNGLHGVISQEIVLFITTAVRTSNPTLLVFISLIPNYTWKGKWSVTLAFVAVWSVLVCLMNSVYQAVPSSGSRISLVDGTWNCVEGPNERTVQSTNSWLKMECFLTSKCQNIWFVCIN